MTIAPPRPLAEGASSAASPGEAPARRLVVPVALQVTAMLGLGAVLYPTGADWFATLAHDADVSGYIEQLDTMPTEERRAALAAADAYNAQMPQGALLDPFSTAASDAERGADHAAYRQLLSVGGSDVIGEFSYPALDIGLPIRHGTANDVISNGVGHLYGSSLPVGGPSTHSVLTAHSGLLNASLFTPLADASLGDVFELSVLGETRYYQVDSITTVDPDDTSSLRIVDGEDYVTLITCTPIGVNSHRLLVRGVRIDAPETVGTAAIAGDGREAGFPWWAVAFLGSSGVVAWLLFAPPRRRRDGVEETA